MSTVLTPTLEPPTAATQQVVMGEPRSLQTSDSDFISNSITIPAEEDSRSTIHDPVFGTHIREAVAILKDWFAE